MNIATLENKGTCSEHNFKLEGKKICNMHSNRMNPSRSLLTKLLWGIDGSHQIKNITTTLCYTFIYR